MSVKIQKAVSEDNRRGLIFSCDPSRSFVSENSSYIKQQEEDLFDNTDSVASVDMGGITTYVVDITPEYVNFVDKVYPKLDNNGVNATLPTSGDEFAALVNEFLKIKSDENNALAFHSFVRFEIELMNFILSHITKDNITLLEGLKKVQNITSHDAYDAHHEEKIVFMLLCYYYEEYEKRSQSNGRVILSKIRVLQQRYLRFDSGNVNVYEKCVALQETFARFGVCEQLLEWIKVTNKNLYDEYYN